MMPQDHLVVPNSPQEQVLAASKKSDTVMDDQIFNKSEHSKTMDVDDGDIQSEMYLIDNLPNNSDIEQGEIIGECPGRDALKNPTINDSLDTMTEVLNGEDNIIGDNGYTSEIKIEAEEKIPETKHHENRERTNLEEGRDHGKERRNDEHGEEEEAEDLPDSDIASLAGIDLEPDAFTRPKRRTTKAVNYKEKTENDIPKVKSHQPGYAGAKRGRRPKSQTDSISPPPSASSQKAILTAANSAEYHSVDEVVPINYQPPIDKKNSFNQILDLKGATIDEHEAKLVTKSGVTIKKGDCIFMICEPPTEPFYIALVLGFNKKDKSTEIKDVSNYTFSVCWFYRPRDLNRRLTDTRLVYASLHRDECPITSFRGFATVKHRDVIEDLDAYRQQPDSFFFDKLYDRYMIKMYDMIPTIKLLHLPPNYYEALHKRFEYIFVEVGKAEDLLSSPKNCEKCLQWCSNSDSISCSSCQKSYHLLCLDPPILTKPKRGFAWYCAACNRKLEEKLAQNRGRMLESAQPSQIIKAEERALFSSNHEGKEEEKEGKIKQAEPVDCQEIDSSSLRYEQMARKFLEADKGLSLEQRRAIEEWPYRYLGVHAKFEDALDLQDRPYARAASRLGSKYQCTSVTEWYDHKVQYYDSKTSSVGHNNKRLKKYYNRSKRLTTPLLPEDTLLEDKKYPVPEEYKDLKPKDYPGWLQPKPKGYIERGGDETSELLWVMPDEGMGDMVEQYIKDCAGVATRLKLTSTTTPNFIDAILLILMRHDYKPEESMEDVSKLTRESLKEPTFSDEEIKRFEDSVRIHGSELYPVFKDVKTQPSSMVVRFYYLWKKTKSGHEIWDNYPGRAKNRFKTTKKTGFDLENPDDDGTYLNSKINKTHVKMKCMFCEAYHSPQWFRAPGAVLDEQNKLCEAFCYRCAKLWRKYAAKWENPIELIKNQEKKSGYANKKRIEFALIEEANLVVKARENYKMSPIKITQKLKKLKTTDPDLDYNYLGSESAKKGRKVRSKNMSNKASKMTNRNSDTKNQNKKEKSTKVSSLTGKKKRAAEDDDLSNVDVKSEGVDKIKKRKYTRRKPKEKGLKFVYNSSDESLSDKRKAKRVYEELDLSPKISDLKKELEVAENQLEENNNGGLFNAFLDMKLRERIESLRKELDELVPRSYENIPVEVKTTSNSKKTTKDTDLSKKYVRRRVYLSKTAVPGSGVFETPPIQLVENIEPPKGKFSFQNEDLPKALEQKVSLLPPKVEDYGASFQSQPMLPPDTLVKAQEAPESNSSNGTTDENVSLGSPHPLVIKEVDSNGRTMKPVKSVTNETSISPAKTKEPISAISSLVSKLVFPFIENKDTVSKNMIKRYISKFDIFNPLLASETYVSPIYQMRSSSRELHSMWKTYQSSRKSRGRANKQFIPLFDYDKRPCCVCREMADISTMLICSNCGLNVHATCYGISLPDDIAKKAGEYNWHCDPCSNDLHPLASTQYLCLLCNSRESNMDQAIKGDPISIPDALKRTVEGRWCHVTCSLLSDKIKYGSKSLQPVYGTPASGVQNIFQTCEVCMCNGGVIATCEVCSKKTHVTCALDYGWKLGFKIARCIDIDGGNIIELKDKKIIGKLVPSFYCDDHIRLSESSEFPTLYSLNDLGRDIAKESFEFKTLIELYATDERKQVDFICNGKLRRHAFDDMAAAFDELAKRTTADNTDTESKQCSRCSRTSSLAWYPNSDHNNTTPIVCHSCHFSSDSDETKSGVPDLSNVNTKKFDYSVYGC